MRARCVTVAVLIAVCGAVPAGAAPWKRITTPDGSSTDQVGLARTGDGVLHVAWHHPTGPNTEDLAHTAITPAGRIGGTTPIQSGWTGFTNTALVVVPGGLRAFWGGFRTTDTSDPQRETSSALSPDGGASWALQPGQVNPSGAQSNASSHAATVRPDGSTLQAFAGHAGAAGSTSPTRRPVASGCGASEQSGRRWSPASTTAPPWPSRPPAMDGIWVLWTKRFGNPDVLARRSNEDATRFGATVDAGHPRDSLQAYKLDASDAGNALDVLANFNIGTTPDAVTSYRRLLPGLTLQASPSRLRKGEQTEVRFTVRDAGDAVSGASVKVGGRSGTTDGRGRATLTLTSSRAVEAQATRTGYTPATKRLAVRR